MPLTLNRYGCHIGIRYDEKVAKEDEGNDKPKDK